VKPVPTGVRPGAVRGAALCIAIIAGCSSTPARLDAPKAVFGLQIAPFATIEECISLDAGERIGFRFDARFPVAFNVHFHDGNAVVMPLTSDGTISESGDFAADRKQVYCLTWEAGAEGNVIDYRISPWPPRR
jgi:hypothetical protein